MKVYFRRHVSADSNAAAAGARARPAGGAPIAGCSAMLYSSLNVASSRTATFADGHTCRATPGRARRVQRETRLARPST